MTNPSLYIARRRTLSKSPSLLQSRTLNPPRCMFPPPFMPLIPLPCGSSPLPMHTAPCTAPPSGSQQPTAKVQAKALQSIALTLGQSSHRLPLRVNRIHACAAMLTRPGTERSLPSDRRSPARRHLRDPLRRKIRRVRSSRTY